MRFVNAMCLRYRLMRRNRCTPGGLVWPPRSSSALRRDRTVARFGSSAHQAAQQFSAGANESCSTPVNVLAMHSKLDNGPCKRSGNRNGRRHQLVELPQSTPLLVVPDRSGWRCWLGVGEAPRRGPSASGSYRFHRRPSAYCDRSRLGHRLGVRSSYRSASASSATRINASSTDTGCAPADGPPSNAPPATPNGSRPPPRPRPNPHQQLPPSRAITQTSRQRRVITASRPVSRGCIR
jgi:hypothetical protein